jgi:two-component system sensor histidine kinase KdpD
MMAKEIEDNWPVREKLAVCISANPSAQYLIARGAGMAKRLDAKLYVVHVASGKQPGGDDQKAVDANIRFAEDLGAKGVQLRGKKPRANDPLLRLREASSLRRII